MSQQTSDPRIKILIISAVALIAGGIFFAFLSQNSVSNSQAATPQIEIESKRYSFGNVSMANGIVRHVFPIKNSGGVDLKISDISTSCMCTKAIFETNNEKSPTFGMKGHGTNPSFWSDTIEPGQSANLEISFDPNAHGPNATGPITRTVTMFSNDNGKNKKHEFVFTANVVK